MKTQPEKPSARPRLKKAPVTKAARAITQADIALRAYFISLDRQKTGHAGDPESDWLEAERQLQAEMKKTRARKPRKTKK